MFSPPPPINLHGKGSTGVVYAPQYGRKILEHKDALYVASFVFVESLMTEAMDVAIIVASVEATPAV